jgi:undecaprenyl-diphosphatase
MNGQHGYFEAAILGLIQGLTEFLPVSSDGHLALASRLLGIRGPHLFFDVMLHAGTLIAVLFVFRKELGQMFAGLWRGLVLLARREASVAEVVAREPDLKMGLLILLASIPTALIGLGLKDFVETVDSPALTGGFLILTGVILWTVRGQPSGRAEVGVADSLLIGVAQGFAVLPGLSRSGSTIAAGLGRGIDRQLAARFSFLLSIPAVGGALLLMLADRGEPVGDLGPILLGGLVAMVAGLFALRALLYVTRGGKLYAFAYYLIPVGALAVILGLLYDGRV